MNKKIPVISIVSVNFEQITQMTDQEVYQQLVMSCRLSRTRIIPAKLRYNQFQVSRGPDRVTVHLLYGDPAEEIARVSFVPVDFRSF